MTVVSVTSGQSSAGLTASGGTNSILVLSGGKVTSTTVEAGGTLTLSKGGIASTTTISSGGTEIVSSGGTAVGATLLNGGVVVVSSGGKASATAIGSGGTAIVSSGGTAVSATLLSGGVLALFGGATDTALTWSSGGTLVVGSGLTLNTAVGGGDTLLVLSGGIASGGTVSGGGTEIVSAGGKASATIVSSGGSLGVLGSGLALTLRGGVATVSSGGLASGMVVSSGGVLTVLASGAASATTLSSGGTAIVSSGGVASGATLLSGGTLELLGGAAESGLTWSGGTLALGSGATLGQAVSSGRTLAALSGGVASGATISSGGMEIVSSGGTASATVVSSGGSETVLGSDFGATVSSGGRQVVSSGGVTSGAALLSGGTQVVSSGGVASATSIASGGTALVSSGGTAAGATLLSGGLLEVQSNGHLAGGVTFSGSGGGLQFDAAVAPGLLGGGITIFGFEPGDTLELHGIPFVNGLAVNLALGNELLIVDGLNIYEAQFDNLQNFAGDFFHASDDGSLQHGTLITENHVACYCRGTMILTDRGEVAVEHLSIGDLVVTLSGKAEPIKWIGRRSYDGRFIADKPRVLPIAIAAGALAEGVPVRDLRVSPAHALYIDDVLVPAEHLLNGATIVQARRVERVEYFHIELAAHAVIFADGAPAETFVDCDNRGVFHNAGEFAALYPDDERPLWTFCAPRLERDALGLTAIRTRLLARAERLGYRRDRDPDFHLAVEGGIIRPDTTADNVYRFSVPAGGGEVWFASRSAAPAEVTVTSRDVRRLGVPVARIVLRDDAGLTLDVRHDHPDLCVGFHPDEASHRWTDGRGRLPESWLHLFTGGFTLEVHLASSGLVYRHTPPAETAAA